MIALCCKASGHTLQHLSNPFNVRLGRSRLRSSPQDVVSCEFLVEPVFFCLLQWSVEGEIYCESSDEGEKSIEGRLVEDCLLYQPETRSIVSLYQCSI